MSSAATCVCGLKCEDRGVLGVVHERTDKYGTYWESCDYARSASSGETPEGGEQ